MTPALLLLAFGTAIAQGPAATAPWDIEQSHTPEHYPLDFTATEGTWMSLDVSPDGTTMVFDLLGHIYEMPVTGGTATALTSGRSWNTFPRYSPDGKSLVMTSDRGGSDDLWVMNRQTGEMQNVSNLPEGVTGGMWSADGRSLYGVAMMDGTQNTVYQFGLHGSKQVLIPPPESTAQRPGAGFRPINHFREDPQRNVILYEQVVAPVHSAGGTIKSYDKRTGQISDLIKRPGGAVSPALSPDGRYLAYVHRDDQVSQLVLHDLHTGVERVLLPKVERDRQDYVVYHHAAYPTMAWLPDSRSLVLWFGGGIHRVNIDDGAVEDIPFAARVQREFDSTIRFPHTFAQGEARTRIHRWAQRVPGGAADGILFETLGDLYLQSGGQPRNLTESAAHESSPVVAPKADYLYFARWSDDELGSIHRMRLTGGRTTPLTDIPAQYGSLSLSEDGRKLAFVRGDDSIRTGTQIEAQTRFELITMDVDGRNLRKLTDISFEGAGFGTRPASLKFSRDGRSLFFTEFEDRKLVLKKIGLDGQGKQTLYTFPHAASATLSPDEHWIVYEEYQRSWVTPFEFLGKAITISAEDGKGVSTRTDAANDGLYHRWSADGQFIQWTRGPEFLEKSLNAILDDGAVDSRSDISVAYPVAAPESMVAFTHARIITVDTNRTVLEDASLLVRNQRIIAVGKDIDIPPEAHVIDLEGRTLMPGIIDTHGHYHGEISPTHTIEQGVASLSAPLAYGVTTLYEVYGTIPKDVWVSDMLMAGKITGPRLFSTGSPMYGSREFRPGTFRNFKTNEDVLEQVRFNKAHGATALKDYITLNRRIRQQLAAAARDEGLNLVVEPGGEGQVNLTRVIDGATEIAHGMGFTSIYQDYIEFFKASRISITPTLIVTLDGPMGENWFHQSERLFEDEKLNRFARKEQLLARLRRPQHVFEDDYFHAELAANLKKLYDAGVSLQLGGHGQMLGLDVHFEMELYAQGGFAPMDIIAIATRNGAWNQGLDQDLGTLEAGKLADLVVLTDNPLEDIRNARNIEYVMKNGVLYSGEDAARVYPHPQPAGKFYFK
jgi:Tol biopolymer transport system component